MGRKISYRLKYFIQWYIFTSMRKNLVLYLILITSISLSALSPERIIFNEAESRYKSGDFDFALNRYKELIQEYPLSEYIPDANFRIAVITLRTGDMEGASLLFDRIETRYMNTRFIDYLPFWKGLIEFKQENWESASNYFAAFLENNPASLIKEAHLYRAKSEYTLGNTKKAVFILENWAQVSRNIYEDPYLLTFYLTLLEKEGDYQGVLELFHPMDENQFKKSWMDRINLIYAESQYKLGNVSEAEIYYQKILDAIPDISSVGFIRLFSIYKTDTAIQSEIFDAAQVRLSGFPVMLNKFLLRVGIDSFENGYPELAASYLWRIWRTGNINEISSLVPVYLAKILVLENDRKGAIEILSAYNNQTASVNELVLYTLSNVLVEEGNWIDAEVNLKAFIFTFPDSSYYSSAAWMYAYTLYRSEYYNESKSVIDTVLADGTGGSYTTDFILLSARIYMKLGNISYALAMFKEYLPFDNNNSEIWFDIIKLQFNQGNYNTVLDSYKKIENTSVMEKETPFVLLLQYIAGLADIAVGNYEDGLNKLSVLKGDVLTINELKSIDPYVRYYRGWAYYKLADYMEAFKWFKSVTSDFPLSGVYQEALYFAGWSVYLLGEYSQAAEYFAEFSKIAESTDKVKGLFFFGKSMYAEEELSEAELIFQNIYTEYPNSQYADDSMFEHGQILEEMGKFSLAISAYQELYNRFRTSSLAEESLFKAGEIYLQKNDYKNAVKSFYYHRLKFPDGKLGDVSLYWGAEASEKMEEYYGAILLLEKLLAEHKISSFRPNALQKIALLYAHEGEYRKALGFYSEFLTHYSDSDSASTVRTQIKKLNLLQSGSDEREAEFLVLIEEYGTETAESRDAHIELAKMYLYKYNGREKEAFRLLEIIASLKNQFKVSASKAVYYLGDYYSIRQDYINAAKSFVEAATLYPENADLTGVALLRASEMAVAAGDFQTAEKMVNLLEINFPSSQWLSEGKRILEENKKR
jgi:cellulose synthase operon protein C